MTDAIVSVRTSVHVLLFIVLRWPGSVAVTSEAQGSSEWSKKYLLSDKEQIFSRYLWPV